MLLTTYCRQGLRLLNRPKRNNCRLIKTLRIMQITGVILLACSLSLSARSVSQTVTFKGNNVSLTTVLEAVKKQTGYVFITNKDDIGLAKPVTVDADEIELTAFLNMVLEDQPFEYLIKGKSISIKRKHLASHLSVGLVRKDPPVTGVVRGPDGQPLAGVNVMVKGTKKGTVTDKDGRFILEASDGVELEISSIGYGKKVIRVTNKTQIVVALEIATSILDEVQYIAYGQTSRRYSVANISTIKAADIEKQPVQNPLLALQGRVPGLEVTQLSGINGGGVKVQIQGQNSIGQGNSPFIVIDGVPYPSGLAMSGRAEGGLFGDGIIAGGGVAEFGSPLNYINPADIESIDILKDADATAIYGSRAANGAILITTKKGKAGKMKLTLNLQQGWGEAARKVDMMNTQQYLEMRREALKNVGKIPSSDPNAHSPFMYAPDLKLWDTTRYTDWQKELIGGTAQYSDLNASISGGTQSLQYLIGGTYNRQTTVFPGDFDERKGSVHFNINTISDNQKFRIQFSGMYMYDRNHLPVGDLTGHAIKLEPNAPSVYNDDGTFNWAQNANGNSTWKNPLAQYANFSEYYNATKNLVTNINVIYNLLPGLDVRSNFGYTNLTTSIYQPSRLEAYAPEQRANNPRTALFTNRNMNSWIAEPQLHYVLTLGHGKIDGLVGATVQKSSFDYLNVYGFGFPTDQLMKTLNAATFVYTDLSTSGVTRFASLFGRLNYNWDGKYLLNFTARRDGSNKFGDENKFRNFASLGIGWIFSEEKWVKQQLPFLGFGKIRGSYGTTGNDQIGDFQYLSIYYINRPSILYQNNVGLTALSIPNPHLQWEETKKLQGGFDLGFFQNRVMLEINYARNRSSNQLLPYKIPTISGFPSYSKNLPALVQNTNWEFMVNTVNVKGRKFTWNSSINLTIPRNKLIKFPGIELTPFASGLGGVIVGQQLGVMKLPHLAGVDPATGNYVFSDRKGNPVAIYTPEDQNILITPGKRWYGGLQNNLTFERFQLDFLIQFVRQLAPKSMFYFNGERYPGTFNPGTSNQPANVAYNWRQPGDSEPVARYNIDFFAPPVFFSDAYYSYDASFVRLKNVSLSWQIPQQWTNKMKIQNARLYLHGQNLATITNYKGLDPENQSSSSLPPLRLCTIGAQMEF